jgi:hypothetical protein
MSIKDFDIIQELGKKIIFSDQKIKITNEN